ncbi:MAG: acyltransferase [Phycisphaerae bacterium]|nr:acyltransferase [Phycisphaerae bacterium]
MLIAGRGRSGEHHGHGSAGGGDGGGGAARATSGHHSGGESVAGPLPTPALLKRPRVSRIDYAKAVAVILVVVGHVVGGLDASKIPEDGLSTALHGLHLKNSFRMPALFLIAGIFAERSLRKGYGVFVREKAGYLLYPYLLWNLINYGVMFSAHEAEAALGRKLVNTPLMELPDFIEMLVFRTRDLWFLYALFLTLALYGLLRLVGLRIRWILAIAFVTHVIARLGLVDAVPMAFQVGRLLFYFTLGAAFADTILAVGHRARLWQPLALALSFGAAMMWFASSEVLEIPHRMDGRERAILDTDNLRLLAAQLPVRMSVSLTGIGALLSLAVLFERLNGPRLLEYLGKISMEVYIVSSFGMVASRILLNKVLGIEQAWILILGGVSAGLISPVLVVWLTNLVGFKYLFRFNKASPAFTSRPAAT